MFALSWAKNNYANLSDTIHNYKLTESAEEKVDIFNQYVFTVRRKFDWENKYKNTVVDIKSKMLREALQEVMKDVKGVSLVEDQPSVCLESKFTFAISLIPLRSIPTCSSCTSKKSGLTPRRH